ncbi:Histidine kinase [Gulbenkiania indica]|uniref:Histidine kinase n=1 Tax=Gulbenkiania indica TaxID=375574 RepID=A0A0K6GWD6_9NEIS|nr:sensor histidine kinase [Gulbenkiania indica]CUA83036.1 Histidine kinase [Gulbenkiania indica]
MKPALLPPAPDLRNLGVMMKILLAVAALVLASLLVRTDGAGTVDTLAETAAWSIPAAFATLALGAALQPWWSRARWPSATLAALAAASTGLLAPLLQHNAGTALRHTLLAAAVSGLIAHYFSLRARVLSPVLAEARLTALNARIRPHFLFNSLNAAIALVRSQPEEAERVLENLAHLFRAHLAEPRRWSTLAEERALARMYLDIEQARLGERLQVQWQDTAPEAARLPPLLLQPLVENAVHHGVEPTPHPGPLTIALGTLKGQLRLEVRNPLPPPGAPPRPGLGIALDNLRERLALLYDAEARLTIEERADERITCITLPLDTGPDASGATPARPPK